ncbi:hypothetical protein Ddye_009475 [Dipteronia dyeriana]|uniref:Uncharacterized protein n=1 Tax=Dipteronia dyeriana TaxID=168575 RepID=A0AAD9XCE5_9ROSI|nr:hypothetical protein Ddye_009475 [Dipteronia dyeriana]
MTNWNMLWLQFVADGDFISLLNDVLIRELGEDGYSNVEEFTRMSSRSGMPYAAGASNGLSSKAKNVSEVTNPQVDQLTHSVIDLNLDSAQADGGWEVYARKSKNRAGSSAAKPWGMRGHNVSGKATADFKIPAGRGNGRPQNYIVPQPAIRSPLLHGWNWQSRDGSTQSKGSDDKEKVDSDSNEDDFDTVYDSDDDELLIGDLDSDASQKSHETRKKSRWFYRFFESLDGLRAEEINEPERQWHCPA